VINMRDARGFIGGICVTPVNFFRLGNIRLRDISTKSEEKHSHIRMRDCEGFLRRVSSGFIGPRASKNRSAAVVRVCTCTVILASYCRCSQAESSIGKALTRQTGRLTKAK
jgi:hypothetical protein